MRTPHVNLQKESPIPLYFQLKEVLKKQIEAGELKPGEVVPSERELMESYEISRPTVRQAIHELVIDGLLTRERGRGTFVAKPRQSQWYLESLSSFSEEVEKKGFSALTKVLNIECVDATAELMSIFGINYKRYYRLERLRFVEGQPVVVVTTFIPYDLAPNLEKEDLVAKSLYSILQNRYNLKIGHANRTLKAVNVTEEDAVLLDVAPMSAVQFVQTIAFLEDNNAFEYSLSRFRGDSSSFTAVLKFLKQSTPLEQL